MNIYCVATNCKHRRAGGDCSKVMITIAQAENVRNTDEYGGTYCTDFEREEE